MYSPVAIGLVPTVDTGYQVVVGLVGPVAGPVVEAIGTRLGSIRRALGTRLVVAVVVGSAGSVAGPVVEAIGTMLGSDRRVLRRMRNLEYQVPAMMGHNDRRPGNIHRGGPSDRRLEYQHTGCRHTHCVSCSLSTGASRRKVGHLQVL